jgi:hypothetical protein
MFMTPPCNPCSYYGFPGQICSLSDRNNSSTIDAGTITLCSQDGAAPIKIEIEIAIEIGSLSEIDFDDDFDFDFDTDQESARGTEQQICPVWFPVLPGHTWSLRSRILAIKIEKRPSRPLTRSICCPASASDTPQ